MRVCWNWQTGTFEGRVLNDVRVQVPSLAPKETVVKRLTTAFFILKLSKRDLKPKRAVNVKKNSPGGVTLPHLIVRRLNNNE